MNILLPGDTASEFGLMSIHIPKALGFQFVLDDKVDNLI
jgi:hypothetical protein